MKRSGVCDFTQDDALIFKFPYWEQNLICACQTDAEKHGRTLTNMQTERWTDEGSEDKGIDRQAKDNRVLPLSVMLDLFGKLTDNTFLRQFTSLSAYAMSVFTMCVGTTLPPYFTPDGIFMPSVSHFLCRHTCTHSHT